MLGTSPRKRGWTSEAFAGPLPQKVLMFLFEAVAQHPRGVVKITRDSTHNFRLENEWRALTSLQNLPIESERTCPAPPGAEPG